MHFLPISYLDELSVAGECAVEYLGLYQKLIKPTHWKVYLAARGVLPYIGNLITKVIFYFRLFLDHILFFKLCKYKTDFQPLLLHHQRFFFNLEQMRKKLQ